MVVGLVFAGSASAFGQEADGGCDRLREASVRVGQMERFEILLSGGGGSVVRTGEVRGECEEIYTHTDADFGGGVFNAQAGFAETEMAGASFTIPENAFPIRVDTMEMVFATQGASVPTTTEWSVLVWDGPPDTGTLVATFSSDGVILPHIELAPGTNAVNVVVQIDPNDPDQIVLDNAGGQSTLTFAYRIDQHNNQTQNPCLIAPPSASNAFPTTDTSGLDVPSGNWLFGVDCGLFGCPPNGGWSTFAALPQYCRPSGDWVMRVTWEPLDCVPEFGACCLLDGTCQVLLESQCDGMFMGDQTTCDEVECPSPTGACCFEATGGCVDLPEDDCVAAGGIPQGAGVRCTDIVCFPIGACCLPDGSCQDELSPEDCLLLEGVFQGDATACATTECPEPVGACCFATGFCLDLTLAECDAAGASWVGAGTACDAAPVIVVQPEDQVACDGESASFSVIACASGPLAYQWRLDGEAIAGATEPLLTIDPVTPADVGEYDVLVENSFGVTGSDVGALVLGLRCDANCDGVVNNFDIDAFVLALTEGASGWEAQYGCGYLCANDTNRDEVVNNFDIDAFVECLTGK